MRLYAGTSGFSYDEWAGSFYPEKLPAKQRLAYYATRLTTVEINNTFYRTPTEKLLKSWTAETPESFVFTLKAPQKITHIARLRDSGGTLDYFLDAARSLGPRLGCILFQCPPNLKHEAERLDGFLAALPRDGMRFAMEFRHPSWREAEVKRKLEDRQVAWCVAEADEEDAPFEQTAERFVYLRLRRGSYDDAGIDRWAKAVASALAGGADAYVYFKHEDDPSGIRYALELQQRIG
jgi:uncharacterized protein YecE (DUF72 family)